MKNRYLEKCAQKLFADDIQRSAFLDCFEHPQSDISCLVWLKPKPIDIDSFLKLEPIESLNGCMLDRVLQGNPGRLNWHDEGYYYILDYSSIMASQVLLGVDIQNPTILDLCASPGGKSVLAFQILKPQLIVCNEPIKSRVKKLLSNLKRCEIKPCGAWSADAGYLATKHEGAFDLVIVDAPCSGQSLLVKDEKNPGAFHPINIKKNSRRQRRIVNEGQRLIKAGGYLAYMTCTYSPEENEEVIDWFLKKNPSFVVKEVPSLKAFQSNLCDYPAYRIWPQNQYGAGSFMVLLQKEMTDSTFSESEFHYIWKNGMT